MTKTPVTVPPRRSPEPHPLDPVIEMLAGLSTAVREMSTEVCEQMGLLGARIDGLSKETQGLAEEVRGFGNSEERLRGRVAWLETIAAEQERGKGSGSNNGNGNGHA